MEEAASTSPTVTAVAPSDKKHADPLKLADTRYFCSGVPPSIPKPVAPSVNDAPLSTPTDLGREIWIGRTEFALFHYFK